MLATLKRLFLAHPATVNETYWEHMRQAMSFSLRLAIGALAAALHAFFPFMHVRTASSIVERLHERMITNRVRVKTQAASVVVSDERREI